MKYCIYNGEDILTQIEKIFESPSPLIQRDSVGLWAMTQVLPISLVCGREGNFFLGGVGGIPVRCIALCCRSVLSFVPCLYNRYPLPSFILLMAEVAITRRACAPACLRHCPRAIWSCRSLAAGKLRYVLNCPPIAIISSLQIPRLSFYNQMLLLPPKYWTTSFFFFFCETELLLSSYSQLI